MISVYSCVQPLNCTCVQMFPAINSGPQWDSGQSASSKKVAPWWSALQRQGYSENTLRKICHSPLKQRSPDFAHKINFAQCTLKSCVLWFWSIRSLHLEHLKLLWLRWKSSFPRNHQGFDPNVQYQQSRDKNEAVNIPTMGIGHTLLDFISNCIISIFFL